MKVAAAKLGLVCVSLIVMSLMWAGVSDAIINPENMVALWCFDEGSGDILHDSSGNENHGELKEGPTWVNGMFDGGLQFDGVDDYVEVPHSESLDTTEAISIVLWAKLTEYPAGELDLLDKGPLDAGSCQYYLSCEGGDQAYSLNWRGQSWHGGDNFNSPLMNDIEWHHVAATYDMAADEVKVYVDGDCNEYTSSDDMVRGEHRLVIGGPRNLDATYAYKGIMDELAIFNVALTEDEIQSLMSGSMAAVAPAGKLATTWAELKRP